MHQASGTGKPTRAGVRGRPQLDIHLGTQDADLRLGHVGDAELVQHPFDFPRADAGDKHLLDGCYERSFASLAVLDQRRNEVSFARSRDP
jgi:hypothetical protein